MGAVTQIPECGLARAEGDANFGIAHAGPGHRLMVTRLTEDSSFSYSVEKQRGLSRGWVGFRTKLLAVGRDGRSGWTVSD